MAGPLNPIYPGHFERLDNNAVFQAKARQVQAPTGHYTYANFGVGAGPAVAGPATGANPANQAGMAAAPTNPVAAVAANYGNNAPGRYTAVAPSGAYLQAEGTNGVKPPAPFKRIVAGFKGSVPA